MTSLPLAHLAIFINNRITIFSHENKPFFNIHVMHALINLIRTACLVTCLNILLA